MNPIHDQPLAGTCAKGTLWGPTCKLACIGTLLIGAVLASMLLIDLPSPIGRATEAPPYVPAAERWIELGAASHSRSSVEAAVVDAVRKL
jgi:hypothetical protein